ncbi:copper-binding periplasmic protein [Deltaproteobacteria bacterium]|nr:copper-binding periplasmic protein [Deltaproteobacteria bacterium]
MIVGFALLTLALAGEHDAAAPAPVAVSLGTGIPEGTPKKIEVAAGADINAAIAGLPAGSTIQLLPGEHRGPVLIDRPLTLLGPARIVGPGQGSVVVVGAPDVTIRNLEITGSGLDATAGDAGVVVGADRARIEEVRIVHTFLGVDLRRSNHSIIRGCTIEGREDGPIGTHGDGIRLWESDHNEIVGNHLEHVRDMVAWYSEHNSFTDNVVEGSRYGAHLMHAEGTHLERNRFIDDVVGIFVMYSRDVVITNNLVLGADGAAGMGIGVKESDALTVTHNRLLASTLGIYIDSAPNRPDSFALFTDNLIAYDHMGLRFNGVRAGARFEGNNLHENHIQVAVSGGGQAGAATFTGNRWSDYTGYDLDGNGVGDLPYAPRSLARSVVDRRPAAAFFDGTPAAMLLDLLAAAFPMWSPPPMFTDDAPRMGLLEHG